MSQLKQIPTDILLKQLREKLASWYSHRKLLIQWLFKGVYSEALDIIDELIRRFSDEDGTSPTGA